MHPLFYYKTNTKGGIILNILLCIFVALFTLIITIIAGIQILGILFIKIPKKDYTNIIGIAFWGGLLYLYYLAITNWLLDYYSIYLWTSIIASIIAFLNINSLKNEARQTSKNMTWQEFLEENFKQTGTKTYFKDVVLKDDEKSKK